MNGIQCFNFLLYIHVCLTRAIEFIMDIFGCGYLISCIIGYFKNRRLFCSKLFIEKYLSCIFKTSCIFFFFMIFYDDFLIAMKLLLSLKDAHNWTMLIPLIICIELNKCNMASFKVIVRCMSLNHPCLLYINILCLKRFNDSILFLSIINFK